MRLKQRLNKFLEGIGQDLYTGKVQLADSLDLMSSKRPKETLYSNVLELGDDHNNRIALFISGENWMFMPKHIGAIQTK